MSFTMPPAIAGDDNNEVSPDAEGARNWLLVTGGLTLAALAGTAALAAKDQVVEIVTQSNGDGGGSDGISMRGSL